MVSEKNNRMNPELFILKQKKSDFDRLIIWKSKD